MKMSFLKSYSMTKKKKINVCVWGAGQRIIGGPWLEDTLGNKLYKRSLMQHLLWLSFFSSQVLIPNLECLRKHLNDNLILDHI